MDYQILVKNLFNDMFTFFNGRQTMDLKTLAEAYPDEPLLLAFISGLDQALSVPYNDVMKPVSYTHLTLPTTPYV